jgi:hypothetical protein
MPQDERSDKKQRKTIGPSIGWSTSNPEGAAISMRISEDAGYALGKLHAERTLTPEAAQAKRRVGVAMAATIASFWRPFREAAGLPELASEWTPEQVAIAMGVQTRGRVGAPTDVLSAEDEALRLGRAIDEAAEKIAETTPQARAPGRGRAFRKPALGEGRRRDLAQGVAASASSSPEAEAALAADLADWLSAGVELALAEAGGKAWEALLAAAEDSAVTDEAFADALAREIEIAREKNDIERKAGEAAGRPGPQTMPWRRQMGEAFQGALSANKRRASGKDHGYFNEGRFFGRDSSPVEPKPNESPNPWLDIGWGGLQETAQASGPEAARMIRQGWAAACRQAEARAAEAAADIAWAHEGASETEREKRLSAWWEAENPRLARQNGHDEAQGRPAEPENDRTLESAVKEIGDGKFAPALAGAMRRRCEAALFREVGRLLSEGEAPAPDPLGPAALASDESAFRLARWLRAARQPGAASPKLAQASRDWMAKWGEVCAAKQGRALACGWPADFQWALQAGEVDDSDAAWMAGQAPNGPETAATALSVAWHELSQGRPGQGQERRNAEADAAHQQFAAQLREQGFAGAVDGMRAFAGPVGELQEIVEGLASKGWAEQWIQETAAPLGQSALAIGGLMRLRMAEGGGWTVHGSPFPDIKDKNDEAGAASMLEDLELGQRFSRLAGSLDNGWKRGVERAMEKLYPGRGGGQRGSVRSNEAEWVWAALRKAAIREDPKSGLLLAREAESAARDGSIEATMGAAARALFAARIDAWLEKQGAQAIAGAAFELFGPAEPMRDPGVWAQAMAAMGRSPEQAARMIGQGGAGAFAIRAGIGMREAFDERIEQRVKAKMAEKGAEIGAGWRLLSKMSPLAGARLGARAGRGAALLAARGGARRAGEAAEAEEAGWQSLREIGSVLDELARAGVSAEQAEALTLSGDAWRFLNDDPLEFLDRVARFPVAVAAERLEMTAEAREMERKEAMEPAAVARRHETLRALGEWAKKVCAEPNAGAAATAAREGDEATGDAANKAAAAERARALREKGRAVRDGLQDLGDWLRENPAELERLPRRFGASALFARARRWHDELARLKSLRGPEKIAAQVRLSSQKAVAAGHAASEAEVEAAATAASWPLAIERVDGQSALAQRLAEQREAAREKENGQACDAEIEAQAAASPIAKWTAVGLASEEALAAEGSRMGHCVGSYGEACAKAMSRIFQVVTPEGKAIATLELRRDEREHGEVWANKQLRGSHNQAVTNPDALEFAEEVARAYTRAMAKNRAELIAAAAEAGANAEGAAELAAQRAELALALAPVVARQAKEDGEARAAVGGRGPKP